jgi:hypothetical protein
LNFQKILNFYFEAGNSGITVFDLDSPANSKSWEAAQSMITDISIDESKSLVYSSTKNGMINSWTFEGEPVKSFGQAVYSINCIEVLDKEQLVIAGDGAGYIYVWDIVSGELLTDINSNAGGISDLFWNNGIIYSSSYAGTISKTLYDTEKGLHGNVSLFTNPSMEIYDFLDAKNSIGVFSFLEDNSKELYMKIATVDLQSGKLVSSVKRNIELEKYESRLYLTTLGLNVYDKSKNSFTLYLPDVTFSISDKGKLSSEENEFFSEENSGFSSGRWYFPEIADPFIISFDHKYASYADENYSGLYDIGVKTEEGEFVYLPFKGEFNEKEYSYNSSLIYPKSLLKSLATFSEQKEAEEGEVVPIVQSRFIYYQDRIYNQDSSYIATSNESNFIKIFDIQKKKLLVNLVFEEMAMRIIRHPTMPIFASLHIDGTINIWSFEDFHLIRSYQLLDQQVARKILIKRGNFESAENMPLLQMHRYFNNQVDYNPLDFRFSPLGDEIWIFMPGSVYNGTKALIFNVLNILTGRTEILPELNDISWENYGQTLPVEVKGEWSKLQVKQWDDIQMSYSRFSSVESQDAKIDSILGVATNEMDMIVPNMFQSNYGKNIVLDYGDFLSSIDLIDLSVNTVAIDELPHKYKSYTSHIEFEKRNIEVSDSTGCVVFWVKRFIDTAYAYTIETGNGYGIQTIDEINTKDFDGRDRISHWEDEKQYSCYYSYDYYLWDLLTQKMSQIEKDEFEAIKGSRSFYVEDRLCDGCEDDWNEYMNEMTAMEAEQKAAHYSESIRGYSDWSSSTSAVPLNCEVCTVKMGNKTIGIKNTSGKLENKIGPQSSAVVDQEFLINSNYFLTNNLNGEMMVWDWKNPKIEDQIIKIVGSGSELFAITPDNYYMTMSPGARGMAFRKNGIIFEFEQFDLKYNRPDIILDRLGYADQSLIDAYHSAYQKRLKKMGFTEDMLQDDFHLPEIKIENFEEMPTLLDQGSIDLKLKLEDTKYKLDRINVWVNDVAVYGSNGISLRDKNAQNYSTSLSVDLAKGMNKVQISVLNQAGAESYKETFEIECTAGKTEPNLYLITIGESEFKQSDFNLTYAAKDAKDIAALFEKSKAYGEVKTKTLVNQEVTKENVVALKAFLAAADINDEVMIFIAGHGVLDANLDYYFATYDMDFQNPADKGLAYEDLESLLDGIKPLKKTLMIDACHSGEIDKDEVVLAEADIHEGDNIQFRVVGNTATPKLGSQNTSELTKSLFTDLRKGTGATVISSAGGMEFAMEGDDWSNGLFTYCFINGIKTKAADYDKNGEIWLSEIKRYVSEQVTELSNGKQQPTSRIENQSIDFRIW